MTGVVDFKAGGVCVASFIDPLAEEDVRFEGRDLSARRGFHRAAGAGAGLSAAKEEGNRRVVQSAGIRIQDAARPSATLRFRKKSRSSAFMAWGLPSHLGTLDPDPPGGSCRSGRTISSGSSATRRATPIRWRRRSCAGSWTPSTPTIRTTGRSSSSATAWAA